MFINYKKFGNLNQMITIKNNRSQIQCNPLIVDGVVYGTTPTMKLFALDGSSGNKKMDF